MVRVPVPRFLTPFNTTTPHSWRRHRCSAHRPENTSKKLQIVFVGTEVSPWSKVGGLGDVLGSLPHALASRGHKVMTVCPRYAPYSDTYDSGHLVPFELSDESLIRVSRLFIAHTKGVDHVFIDHPVFQEHSSGVREVNKGSQSPREVLYPYWSGDDGDFETCYNILCQVALAAPGVIWQQRLGSNEESNLSMLQLQEKVKDACNGEGLVFVANDWPCGILPMWLENYKAKARQGEFQDQLTWEGDFKDYSLKDNGDSSDLKDASAEAENGSLSHGGSASKGSVPEAAEETKYDFIGQAMVAAGIVSKRSGTRGRNAIELENQDAIPDPCLWPFQSWVGRQLTESKVAFVIHNIAYQGRPLVQSLDKLGYPGALGRKYVQKLLENANWLKAGLLLSDAVTTVSPGYALELLRGGWEAFGLWETIQKAGLKSIRNGIDDDVWNPQKDKFLGEDLQYGVADVAKGKHLAKMVLQEKLGLKKSPSIPLFGFIGRLEHQKGVDLLLAAVPGILRGPALPEPQSANIIGQGGSVVDQVGHVQLAVLGSGEGWLEEGISALQCSYPGYAVGVTGFNEELAHQMLAGCDCLLVPSRFEPCGLVAMCAARYGCIPVVAPVGGLRDLLSENIGYALNHSPNTVGFRSAVLDIVHSVQVAALEHGTKRSDEMRRRCMNLDVSWDRPAAEWETFLLETCRGSL